jgi:prepilin-type N-terminal cleavage/methylation domain-containing protein
MRQQSRRLQRGFTLVELMIVVGVIGVIASLAIPNYLRFTARSSRSEMLETISKMKLHFKNVYDNTGNFASGSTAPAGTTSGVNPDAAIPVGQATNWNNAAAGWTDLQFPPEGAIKMRYWYTIQPPAGGGQDLVITACGSFPGMGNVTPSCPPGMVGSANYRYDETFHSNGSSEPPVEIPSGLF